MEIVQISSGFYVRQEKIILAILPYGGIILRSMAQKAPENGRLT